jgi:flagellar assembly protein FliH
MASVLKSGQAESRLAETEKNSAARQASGLAGFNLNDLASEGQKQLEACKQEVQRMIQQAETDAKGIRKAAQEQGHQEGLRRAEAEIEQKIKNEGDRRAKDELKLVHHSVHQMHEHYSAWMSQYSSLLHGIALAAAEKVTRRKLEQESDLLLTWVSEAVMSTRSASRLSVAVHPETLADLGEKLDTLLASPDLPESSQVVPDATLGLADVVVRQTGGEIHAGLQAQLDRLAEMLR